MCCYVSAIALEHLDEMEDMSTSIGEEGRKPIYLVLYGSVTTSLCETQHEITVPCSFSVSYTRTCMHICTLLTPAETRG